MTTRIVGHLLSLRSRAVTRGHVLLTVPASFARSVTVVWLQPKGFTDLRIDDGAIDIGSPRAISTTSHDRVA